MRDLMLKVGFVDVVERRIKVAPVWMAGEPASEADGVFGAAWPGPKS